MAWAPPGDASSARRAQVLPDGTLKVDGRRVHLYGIYIPPTGKFCNTKIRPSSCGSRAAVALDFKIQGFVYCDQKARYTDGSVSALCQIKDGGGLNDRVDLSAYLLSRGWAVALPTAPFEYHTLERIARHRGLGVWGFQADSISR